MAIVPKSTQTAVKNRASRFVTESSGAFVDATPTTSTSSFVKNSTPPFFIPLSNATSAWQGDNLSGGEFGYDDIYSGIPFGEGEFGGIKHFEGS